MASPDEAVPVHDSLTITDRVDVYHNEEWWKAVVTYYYDDPSYDETAVYLWHHEDEGWTRKNKYVIKTTEAWLEDVQIVERLLESDASDDITDEFPVSDYYHVATGETVFRTDEWWKAILNVDKKGTYETNDVMIYLWQQRDDDWRRRQKYPIKGKERWKDEKECIESLLGDNVDSTSTPTSLTSGGEDTNGPPTELDEEMEAVIKAHLSDLLE